MLIIDRILVEYSVKLVSITALHLHMYLENKRRDRTAIGGDSEEAQGIENGMLVNALYRLHLESVLANQCSDQGQMELNNTAFRYVI